MWNLFLQSNIISGLEKIKTCMHVSSVRKSMFVYTLVVYAVYAHVYSVPVYYSSVSNTHNLHVTQYISVAFDYITWFFLLICK